LQGMGLQEDVQVSIGRLHLRRGDRLLVCCDGLSNLVDDNELRDLLSSLDLKTACNKMVDLANERGGDDNITAIVASLDGAGLPVPGPDETVTQTFEVLQEFEQGGKKRSVTPRPTPPDEPARAPVVDEPAAPVETPADAQSPWPLVIAVVTVISVMGFVIWLLR
ncbi:MAG: hypothetical protein WCJ30_17505, partial [Deltaproteobacteria bacterium]